MTPTFRACTTPEYDIRRSFTPMGKVYRLEADGKAIGPNLTETEARTIAWWLELAYEELP